MKAFVLRFLCIAGLLLSSAPAWSTYAADSLSSTPARPDGQPRPAFFRRVVAYVGDLDTLYVEPNRYNLAFMLENSNWYETYTFRSTGTSMPQKLRLAPDMNYRLGVYFGWRWIFVGYSVDLRHLFGKKSQSDGRTEFSLSLYSSVAGCDIFYRKSGNHFSLRNAGDFRPEGFTGKLPDEVTGLNADIAGLSAYWVHNHRRFSYPAAYSQSTNQRRSAGSLLVGFTFSKHKMSFDYHGLPVYVQEQLDDRLKSIQIDYTSYCLNAGYAYNWVFARNCLFNLSLAPGIAYKRSISDSEYQSKSVLRKINFDLVTRTGITWNNNHYYVGASLVMNTFGYRSSAFSISNSFGTLRIYAGFNFWKKKEYRNKP